jgi:hypothetical protein
MPLLGSKHVAYKYTLNPYIMKERTENQEPYSSQPFVLDMKERDLSEIRNIWKSRWKRISRKESKLTYDKRKLVERDRELGKLISLMQRVISGFRFGTMGRFGFGLVVLMLSAFHLS